MRRHVWFVAALAWWFAIAMVNPKTGRIEGNWQVQGPFRTHDLCDQVLFQESQCAWGEDDCPKVPNVQTACWQG